MPKSNDPSLDYDILVPLNISWDTAALALDTAFPTVRDWLGALLEWLATRPGLKLCIRQHPRERLGFAKSNDDLGDFVAGLTRRRRPRPLRPRRGAGEHLRFA